MIVTTVLTLTLLIAQPDALVQVFSPTQAVTITKTSNHPCVQVDAFWIQCWGADANEMQLTVSWQCNDPLAVIVLRMDDYARLYEMRRCRWQQYLPFIAKE
jgi:hypothetical protein